MSENTNRSVTKAEERNVFIFTTAVLIPAITVAFVGGYGFLIWMSQILTGPPT